MKVLICGGRDFDDWGLFRREVTRIDRQRGQIRFIIHGGASGADSFARKLARDWNIKEDEFKAEWRKYGRAAGPIRNQQMLDEGKPDLVIAFPGNDGTADMVERARAANIEVIEIKDRAPFDVRSRSCISGDGSQASPNGRAKKKATSKRS